MTQKQIDREYEFDAADLPIEFAPHPSLLTYYVVVSLLGGPFFPIILLPLYIRYTTLRYRLDQEGIRMRRGMLFRREVSLAYRRIQDIHLSSNVVERWLGLGKVRIQTASGGAEAEITVEGMMNVDGLRDFLYARSRGSGASSGAADHSKGRATIADTGRIDSSGPPSTTDPLSAVLGELLVEVRGLRNDLAERSPE